MIDKRFIVSQYWMVQGLHLKGYELLTFGLIYGFCQDGTPKELSLRYLEEWLLASKRTITRILKKLKNRNLIIIDYKEGSSSVISINIDGLNKQMEASEKELREKEESKEFEKRSSYSLTPKEVVNKILNKKNKEEVKEVIYKDGKKVELTQDDINTLKNCNPFKMDMSI